MMFNSRGFKDAAAKKGAELEAALLKASLWLGGLPLHSRIPLGLVCRHSAP